MPDFPTGSNPLPPLGRDVLTTDRVIVEGYTATLASVGETLLGAPDGSTPGSPWEAIVEEEDERSDADVALAAGLSALDSAALKHSAFAGSHLGELVRTGANAYAVVRHNRSATVAPTSGDNFAAGYSVGSEWINTTAQRTYVCVGNGAWVRTDGSGDPSPIAEWNGVDASQFTVSGDANWTASFDSLGPENTPRMVLTTTVAAGTKDRFFVFDPGLVLPSLYTVDFLVGPYTGNNNALHRVQIQPVAHYTDSTHFIGAVQQGDNAGGTASLNAQSMIANGGARGFAALASNVFAHGGHPTGRMRMRVSKMSGGVAVGVDLFGGRCRVNAAYTTGSLDKVGFIFAHYGQSQAIGDSGYLYGLRIYAGHLY